MKYKMTAVLVALAMMFAGVFVMADGDGADATVESKTISIAQGETQTFQLMTNEKAYSTASAGWTSYEAKWSVKEATDNTMTADGITYSATKVEGDANFGLYNVKMVASDSAASTTTPATHTLVFTVTLTFAESSTAVLTYEYPLSVTITAKAAAVTLAAMKATQNVPFTAKISAAEGSTLTVDNYDWYAIGLPAGLGMAKDGTVSGLATTGAAAADYKLTAVEKATSSTSTVPKTYSFTLNLTVVAATTSGSVILTFENADVVGGTAKTITFSGIGGKASVTPSDTAFAEEGTKNVKFTVSTSEGSTVSVTKVVTIDGTNGTEKEVAGGATEYTLDTSGTGSYKTKVYVNVDGQDAVLVFDFLVLENVHGAWTPSIVINGN